jgi:hypothetical protein
MSSVCQVNGSACHAISPAAMACSMSFRSGAAAFSRYSYTSHDPVLHT